MIREDKVRIWATIDKNTRKTIDLLRSLPHLKDKSIGEIIEISLVAYAMAIIDYVNNINETKKKEN